MDSTPEILEIGPGEMPVLTLLPPPFQPGLDVILELEMLDLFSDKIPGVEYAPINALPDGSNQAAGPLPGVQGVIVSPGENAVALSFPPEVDVKAMWGGFALPAAQRFPLKFPLTLGAFLHSSDFSSHGKIIRGRVWLSQHAFP